MTNRIDVRRGPYHVTGPHPLPDLMAECGLTVEDVADLPPNWRELNWFKGEQDPCLIGDDLRIAVDRESEVAYVIFDAVCGDWYWYDGETSLEELLLRACEYGDEQEPPEISGQEGAQR